MKYSLGLDLGTTSVGWAIINEDKKRIEDLGVRIFERPENPKNGESLAKPRRDARSTRRRLKRRRQRLNYLKSFFIEHKLLKLEEINDELFHRYDPYQLREQAISKKLPNNQLFVALYHIAKRRGYKSNRRKVEEASTDSRKVLGAIKENQKLLEQYKSVAQALLEDDKFKSHKRNRLDDYTNSFIREDFQKEIILILKTQGWSDDDIFELLDKKPHGLFYQRPFMTEELINKMRGKCPYEKGEQRAWKASYTFEIFRLAQDLANLTYNDGQRLTPEQIRLCIEKAQNTQKVTYKAIRETIGHKNSSDFRFDYIRGKKEASYEDEEKHEFCNLKFYHDIRKATKDSSEDLQRITANQDLFDKIGYILTANKDDEKVKGALSELELSPTTTDYLMGLSYSKFAHLSIKALRKLTPHLLIGMTYDQAVEAEYPGEFSEKLSGDKNELPVLSEEEQSQITNPVVKRAINQTRKVVNAIIKKYGAPTQIKIECANELSKNYNERKKIKDRQDENAANNKRIISLLQENFNITNPSGKQITKYKLWEEQLNKCQYCGKPLSLDIFIDDKLAEIDHIIPFSRCGNDSNANKALVCSSCNQPDAV
ncbi:type II CRISPR RNA-guided endonuclease Cas9 [Candidatus Saccharibacteria bacterium]|nr:type II CRISPR RNA-guided endonuclease Cas9 [Candidatus Saccharibacteria bacterium]